MTTRKSDPEDKLKSVLEQIGPEFIEESARQITREDLLMLSGELDAVSEKFGKDGALERFRDDGKLMISLLRDYTHGRYESIPLWTISIVAFTLKYVAKPIDIIPDSLPIIGQLDDAVVVGHGLAMIGRELRAYKIWKLAGELE